MRVGEALNGFEPWMRDCQIQVQLQMFKLSTRAPVQRGSNKTAIISKRVAKTTEMAIATPWNLLQMRTS